MRYPTTRAGSGNDLWLLTEVHHEDKQPQELEESVTNPSAHNKHATGDFRQGYRNRFTATLWDVPFRPPLHHPKPGVLGCQTAVVTVRADEEIY